ncbi:MAG: aldose 1-epimerase family protein [Planctomycetes bacterium]|nr:aldose 1-epimerase family protein [Planctomycetota bacterium]
MQNAFLGHPDQELLLRSLSLEDGPGRGMRVVHILNGSGFFLEILPDRGLDIAAASWHGRSLAWFSAAGLRHPDSYEPAGAGWVRGFAGGLLVTCGLDQVGASCEDSGSSYGVHGRFSFTPAAEVYSVRKSTPHGPVAEIGGVVRQGALFAENLTLSRRITVPASVPAIEIHDTVTNDGSASQPFMLLYHMNFGYPLVQPGTQIVLPEGSSTSPRDPAAADGVENALFADAPRPGYSEKVYYHRLPPADVSTVSILSPDGWSARLSYSSGVLSELVQWKMMGPGEYVMGLEPANCRVSGRSGERDAGRLRFLEPGETVSTSLSLELFE